MRGFLSIYFIATSCNPDVMGHGDDDPLSSRLWSWNFILDGTCKLKVIRRRGIDLTGFQVMDVSCKGSECLVCRWCRVWLQVEDFCLSE